MLEESSKLLAAYPLLNVMFAVAVGVLTLWGMYSAEKRRRDLPSPQQLPENATMFFDGPLKVLLDHMGVIRNIMVKWDVQWEMERKIADKIKPQEDQIDAQDGARDRERWDDMFKLARDIQSSIARLADRPRR